MLVLTLATPPQEGVDISVIYTVEMLHFQKKFEYFYYRNQSAHTTKFVN